MTSVPSQQLRKNGNIPNSELEGRAAPAIPSIDAFSATWILQLLVDYTRQIRHNLVLTTKRWHIDDGSTMAAAVAYYLALSLFPMLLLMTATMGLVLRYTQLGHDFEVQLLAIVAEHCSPTLSQQFETVLLQIEDQSAVGCPLGVATAVLAAIGVFHQFERAFDKIWRVHTEPSQNIISTGLQAMTSRLIAFGLLLGLAAAILLILIANIALAGIREWMAQVHLSGTTVIGIVDAAATILLHTAVFGMLYKFLPKRPVRWGDALRGGLLISLIWEVGRVLLSVILVGVKYTSAYGAIGSFIALLLWFYWGVTLILFGAEYVQVLSRRHARPFSMFRKR